MVNKAVKNVPTTRALATFESLKGYHLYCHFTCDHVCIRLTLLCPCTAGWPIFKKPSRMKQQDNVVAVRVHQKDRSRTGESYYLGKVTGPLRQLKEGGKYEGNWYDQGFWVFELTWYHYVGTGDVEGVEGSHQAGDRHYVLGNSSADKCTMQLNGVVTGIEKTVFAAVVKRTGKDKLHVLSNTVHDAIMTKGNLAA
jgi:hypothetical protein